jgi:hypothetical protein
MFRRIFIPVAFLGLISLNAASQSPAGELFVSTVHNILDMNELIDFSVDQGIKTKDLGVCKTVPASEAIDLVVNDLLSLEKEWIRAEQKTAMNEFLTNGNDEVTFCLNEVYTGNHFHYISTHTIMRESDQQAITLVLRWIDGSVIDEP